ncbi:hypothetical protein EDD86DRAFT_214161 [Gorgonomyces haynaldii]|nr:hypothetical protein EDD86DRAFT_214161 [Gorgonomyces haynaldii]
MANFQDALKQLESADTMSATSQALIDLSNHLQDRVQVKQVYQKVQKYLDNPQLKSSACSVLKQLLTHHYQEMDDLRLEIYDLITQSNPSLMLPLLQALTNGGRDLRYIEHRVSPLMKEWCTSVFSGLIGYLVNLVKYSYTLLDPDMISYCLEQTLKEGKESIPLVDCLLKYGHLPEHLLEQSVLVCLDEGYAVLKLLLASHFKSQTVLILLTPHMEYPNAQTKAVVQLYEERLLDQSLQVIVDCLLPLGQYASEFVVFACDPKVNVNSLVHLSCRTRLSFLHLVKHLQDRFKEMTLQQRFMLMESMLLKNDLLDEASVQFLVSHLDDMTCFKRGRQPEFVEMMINALWSRSLKQDLIQKLYKIPFTPTKLVLKLLDTETDPATVESVLQFLSQDAHQMDPLMFDEMLEYVLEMALGTKGESVQSFWKEQTSAHTQVKPVQGFKAKCHPRLAFPILVSNFLISMFHSLNLHSSDRLLIVFAWMCRLGCWIEMDHEARLVLLKFLATFKANSNNVISYKLDQYYLTGLYSDKMNMIEYVYCIQTILMAEISYQVLQVYLELLAHQLQYKNLFVQVAKQMDQIRARVCLNILKERAGESLMIGTESRISDLYYQYILVLSGLLHLKQWFQSKEQDDIVGALLFGLGRWPSCGKLIMETLTLCLHQIPKSMVKYCPQVTQKISQSTSQSMMVPNLLFLSNLAKTNIYSNFTEQDYKQVLGVCLYYLRGYSEKTVLNQYVSHLGYYCLQQWFLCIKRLERPKYVGFVLANLVREEMDENMELVLDVMIQNAYMDCYPMTETPNDNNVKSFVHGNTIISISHSDQYNITVRRPTGVYCFKTQLLNPLVTLGVTRKHSRSLSTTDLSPNLDPAFLYLQIMMPQQPQTLVMNEQNSRAISVLDRTPVTELHKIGVVYVGSGQKTEQEILSNTCGSWLYQEFLLSLGNLHGLLNSKRYTGGLDTSPSLIDGPHCIFYSHDQRLDQVIFHVTSLMPTVEHDPGCTFKKRHIGNDYVNIIWNESGLEYNHDIIPGQFNFFLIIIEPVFGSMDQDPTYSNMLFNITVSVGSQVQDPKPSLGLTLVNGSALGSFVRQLAVHLNMLSQIQGQSSEFVSNCKERLRQIKRISARSSKQEPTLDFTVNL